MDVYGCHAINPIALRGFHYHTREARPQIAQLLLAKKVEVLNTLAKYTPWCEIRPLAKPVCFMSE